jgi:cell wall-associated NlpC family hydrolase
MIKQDLTKFVGIPYEFLGTDFTGVDCIGLCQLFYFQHGIPLIFRDGRPITKDWYLTEPYRMVRWFLAYFQKIEDIVDLQYGDVVIFEINGESHTGIYIDDFKVLTVLELFKKSMIIRLRKQNILYRCGFRLKEGE